MEEKRVDEYLEKITIELKLKGMSNRTIQSYNFFLKPFLQSVENPETITLDGVKKFLAGLIDKYSNKSRALAICSLRFFFKKIVKRPDILEILEIPKK